MPAAAAVSNGAAAAAAPGALQVRHGRAAIASVLRFCSRGSQMGCMQEGCGQAGRSRRKRVLMRHRLKAAARLTRLSPPLRLSCLLPAVTPRCPGLRRGEAAGRLRREANSAAPLRPAAALPPSPSLSASSPGSHRPASKARRGPTAASAMAGRQAGASGGSGGHPWPAWFQDTVQHAQLLTNRTLRNYLLAHGDAERWPEIVKVGPAAGEGATGRAAPMCWVLAGAKMLHLGMHGCAAGEMPPSSGATGRHATRCDEPLCGGDQLKPSLPSASAAGHAAVRRAVHPARLLRAGSGATGGAARGVPRAGRRGGGGGGAAPHPLPVCVSGGRGGRLSG